VLPVVVVGGSEGIHAMMTIADNTPDFHQVVAGPVFTAVLGGSADHCLCCLQYMHTHVMHSVSPIAPVNLPPASTSRTLLLLQLTVMRTSITCFDTALTWFYYAAVVLLLQLTMTRAAATS
jgi:hypothetical protein